MWCFFWRHKLSVIGSEENRSCFWPLALRKPWQRRQPVRQLESPNKPISVHKIDAALCHQYCFWRLWLKGYLRRVIEASFSALLVHVWEPQDTFTYESSSMYWGHSVNMHLLHVKQACWRQLSVQTSPKPNVFRVHGHFNTRQISISSAPARRLKQSHSSTSCRFQKLCCGVKINVCMLMLGPGLSYRGNLFFCLAW